MTCPRTQSSGPQKGWHRNVIHCGSQKTTSLSLTDGSILWRLENFIQYVGRRGVCICSYSSLYGIDIMFEVMTYQDQEEFKYFIQSGFTPKTNFFHL